jgi:hypothetical protein
MNTNNEMNIIRGILNEAVIQTQPTGKSFIPPKASSIFTPISSVPSSTSAPVPTTTGIQTKRPMSYEELMGMVKKSTAKTQDALQAGKRRDAAVADYRASAPAAPNEAAIRQDARASFTTDGRWDADKYKAWRAGRAAEGSEWAQRGEARDRVVAVKKENEKYLGDLKANLQQSRTAKTPEERTGAFNMAMTNVDTFVSNAEGRQQKIDADRTARAIAQAKPQSPQVSNTGQMSDEAKQINSGTKRYLSSEEMADMQRKANAAPSTDKYAPSNLPDLTDKPDPNNRQPSGRQGTVAPSYTDWKNGVTRTPPKPQPGKYDKVTASGTPYTDLRAQSEDRARADLAAANKAIIDIQKQNRDKEEAEKMINDVIAIAKTVKTK